MTNRHRSRIRTGASGAGRDSSTQCAGRDCGGRYRIRYRTAFCSGCLGCNGKEREAEQPQFQGQDNNNGNPNNSSCDGRVAAGRGVDVASAAGVVYGTWEDTVNCG